MSVFLSWDNAGKVREIDTRKVAVRWWGGGRGGPTAAFMWKSESVTIRNKLKTVQLRTQRRLVQHPVEYMHLTSNQPYWHLFCRDLPRGRSCLIRVSTWLLPHTVLAAITHALFERCKVDTMKLSRGSLLQWRFEVDRFRLLWDFTHPSPSEPGLIR